jgi:glycine dehydrogenase subunit 2
MTERITGYRLDDTLIFEKSEPGRYGYEISSEGIPEIPLKEMFPEEFLREEEPDLPEVTEVGVVRHYTNLSKLNHSVDNGFYPLGSCTMKYNPKLNEAMASLEGFQAIHPYQPESTLQGAMALIYHLQESLKELSGMDAVTLQPAAGAQGEYAGMRMIYAYHKDRNDTGRKKVIVPDSAHGTNPASAAMCGYEIVEIPSTKDGRVDLEALEKALGPDSAAIMLTNPNTLGLFERNICEIAKLAHNAGALLYYDGANFNAIMGKVRPGDMGFDVMHFNLHKTFSTPHGMGGPGSGPVGVKAALIPFLPVPVVEKNRENETFYFNYHYPKTIGKVRAFYGNFNVLIRAMTYILTMGGEGLKTASEIAVLNANYLRVLVSEFLSVPYNETCMHEFVADGTALKECGIKTLDVAKSLLDYGIHPPTIYFPLIVHEAIMVEPTETETKATLDKFAALLRKLIETANRNPELLKDAPITTPVRRLDETSATKNPIVRYTKPKAD